MTKNILILGAGFGGLECARALARVVAEHLRVLIEARDAGPPPTPGVAATMPELSARARERLSR